MALQLAATADDLSKPFEYDSQARVNTSEKLLFDRGGVRVLELL